MKNIIELTFKAMLTWLLVFVMIVTPGEVFLNLDTAHANNTVTEYPPQGLNSSGWVITDEYNNNVLTNLTDNNPATYSTISSNPATGTAGFVINLGNQTVLDRVYLTGPTTSEGQSSNDGNPANWSNTNNSPPLGIIVVYISKDQKTWTQVGQAWVPYDAGNPVDTEADIRFQPVVGQYVRVELQTANFNFNAYTWGASTYSSAVTLPWNVGEVEVHGFAGQSSITNKDAVLLPANAAAAYTAYNAALVAGTLSNANNGNVANYVYYLPLITAAQDLSYYLGKIEDNPVPIITSTSQESSYPGTIYAIEDLQPLAPNYTTMIANEKSGNLPVDISVTASGNQVQFSGWPYRNVLKSVWTFLAAQGVHWVYPTPHGDYIPVNGSVNLSILPLTASSIALPNTTTPKTVYANWPLISFMPLAMTWGLGAQPMRQGFLNLMRNGWNFSWNALGVLGGSEIPSPVPTSQTISSTLPNDYSQAPIAFTSYPHNLSGVVPLDVLQESPFPGDTDPNSWCGYVASSGTRVCSTGGQPTFDMTNPDLITWVANEITAESAYAPVDLSGTSGTTRLWYGLLPIDAASFDQGPTTIRDDSDANGNPIPDPLPWVAQYYNASQSGAYYNFVNQVAIQTKAQNPSNPPLIGALAYADDFLPPPSWLVPTFSNNVKVDICQYGSPNLPISTATSPNSPNYAFKQVLDQWYALASTSRSLLGNYDYALLLTDFWQPNPQLPVPMVAGIVDRAQYLAKIGALEGGSQANASSMPYNPWDFYAYARIRQNTTLTANQIENEFFTSYFKEAAVPMLAYYQAMENWQVQNNVNMHDIGYADSIMPGSFPNQILLTMYGYLQEAQNAAQSWIVKKRVADMVTGFNWILIQRNLESLTINTGGSNYKVGDLLNIGDSNANIVQVTSINPATSVSVVNGGSGYAVGNIVEITGGANGNARATVTAVGTGGAIANLSLLTGGAGYSSTTNLNINSGWGTGAVVNITTVQGMIAGIAFYSSSTLNSTESDLALSYPSGVTGTGSGATVNLTAMANLDDTTPYQIVGQTVGQSVSLDLQNGVNSLPYLNPDGNNGQVQASSGTQGQFCSGSLTGYGVPSSACPGAFWSLLGGEVYLPVYFAQAGTYTITINAQGSQFGSSWANPPSMTVYLGPQNIGTITVPVSSTPSNFTLTATVPAGYGVQDLWIQDGNQNAIAVDNISVTLTSVANTQINYGAISGDSSPTIYDAELAAQASVGSITLTTTQQQEDEVDGTGKVDIYDAFLIAEYAVGLISTFPVGT